MAEPKKTSRSAPNKTANTQKKPVSRKKAEKPSIQIIDGVDLKLTPKQALFVIEYLVDLNATQAAIRAGYSENTAAEIGSEYLRKPHIASAIQAAMNQRASKALISADDVIRDLMELRDICLGRKPIVSTVFSTVEGTKVPMQIEQLIIDPPGAKGALELLGKHLKLYTDKTEISGDKQNPLQLLVQQVSGSSLVAIEDDED